MHSTCDAVSVVPDPSSLLTHAKDYRLTVARAFDGRLHSNTAGWRRQPESKRVGLRDDVLRIQKVVLFGHRRSLDAKIVEGHGCRSGESTDEKRLVRS